MQPAARANVRTSAGAPLELVDPDDEDSPRFGGRFSGKRYQEPSGPWWRPSSTVGRVFLGLGVLAVLGAVTAGILSVKSYLSRDSRFRIAGASNIDASGLTEVTRAQMLPVFGEDIGRNVFFVPLNERRKQLESIPWVQRATVMRLLPDRIRVSLVERTPVAFVRQGQQVGLVDADGVLLTMPAATMAQHHYSFPVVTGIEPHDPPAARRMRMAVYQRLLAELDANNQRLSQQISEIDLTDPQDARVLMPEQGKDVLAHFGDDRFLDRYQRYKAHIAEWRQQYPKLAAVDLRYESQVVLEMTPGTDAVSATLGSDGSSETNLVAAPAKPPAGMRKTEVPPSEEAAVQPAPSKPIFTKPSASSPEVKKAASKPEASETASIKKQPRPTLKQVAAKPASTFKTKASAAKGKAVEALAAKQRAARLKAAKLKAAREKALRDKKHAATQHTAAAPNKKPSHPAAATAEGQ